METTMFGNVVDQETLQIMIDTRAEKFNAPWYKQYFTFAVPQLSLTYSSVLGTSTITPAAPLQPEMVRLNWQLVRDLKK